MVGGLKVVRVKAGLEQEFERLFGQLREEMRAHEPGCLLYSLLRSRTDPRDYIVHEQYADQAALDAHQKSSYGAVFFPKMRAIVESITVEYFDGVVD
jgi:quinol monooxygenase YgiN